MAGCQERQQLLLLPLTADACFEQQSEAVKQVAVLQHSLALPEAAEGHSEHALALHGAAEGHSGHALALPGAAGGHAGHALALPGAAEGHFDQSLHPVYS